MVHRIVYTHLVGPITTETLDHLCGNTKCAAPEHLVPASRADNAMRGHGPGALNARKTHCVNGHPFPARTPGRRRRCRPCHARDERERYRDARRRRQVAA